MVLLPPSHVPTPSLGPPAHRPLAPRINEWGPGASRPETYDWVAEYTPDYAATERRSDVGGVFGQAARLLQEIAELVPEGSTLVLHPNADAVLPRHGTLVTIARDSGRTRNVEHEDVVSILPPGPTSYDPNLEAVRPKAPAARITSRLQQVAEDEFSTDYSPNFAAVEPRPPAADFARGTGREPTVAEAAAASMMEGVTLWLDVDNAPAPKGAIEMATMLGRDDGNSARESPYYPMEGAPEYDVRLSLVTPRPRAADFARASGRDSAVVGGGGGGDGGDILDLEPNYKHVERAAPAADFATSTTVRDQEAVAVAPEQILRLEVNRALVEPSAKVLVTMPPEGPPKRKRRIAPRLPADPILDDINAELARMAEAELARAAAAESARVAAEAEIVAKAAAQRVDVARTPPPFRPPEVDPPS